MRSKIPRGTDKLDYIKALPGTTLRTTQKKSTAGGMVAGAAIDLFSQGLPKLILTLYHMDRLPSFPCKNGNCFVLACRQECKSS